MKSTYSKKCIKELFFNQLLIKRKTLLNELKKICRLTYANLLDQIFIAVSVYGLCNVFKNFLSAFELNEVLVKQNLHY